MKILLAIEKCLPKRFLATISDDSSIKEIKDLLNKGRNRKAISLALVSASDVKEIEPTEIDTIDIELILSERQMSWDLT